MRVDERTLRIVVVVIGHLIFLSAAALRLVRGQRGHWIRERSPWFIEYYPPLVWLPLLVVTLVTKDHVDLPDALVLAGVPIALAGTAFAAWGMWSLRRGYGIRTDLFEGHELKTNGPFAVVRHPMYLGILVYHVGATLALASPLLFLATVVYVVPFTLARIRAEERVLRAGFGERYDAYSSRTKALLPH